MGQVVYVVRFAHGREYGGFTYTKLFRVYGSREGAQWYVEQFIRISEGVDLEIEGDNYYFYLVEGGERELVRASIEEVDVL
jgi:hypothetical protein